MISMHLEIRSLCFVSGQVAQKHWSSCTFLWALILSASYPELPSMYLCPMTFQSIFSSPSLCTSLDMLLSLCELSWLLFSSGNVGVKGISCFARMLPCWVQQELPGSCLVQLLRVASCLATHPENPQSWEVTES